MPTGRIVGADRGEHPDFNHGTVDYPRPLTDAEIASYELTPLADDSMVYRVRCAVVMGKQDRSVAAWRAIFDEAGATVFAEEDHRLDDGLDCQLLVLVRDRRTVWTAVGRLMGMERWCDQDLVLSAAVAKPWEKRFVPPVLEPEPDPAPEPTPDPYAGRARPQNLAQYKRFFKPGDPIDGVWFAYKERRGEAQDPERFTVIEVNTVGLRLNSDKRGEDSSYLSYHKAKEYAFTERGWTYHKDGEPIARYEYATS